ncbi:helicase IV [Arthrobacter sp. Hiyo1]|nr:helicase IV [Arthrobacter sp. Hiyo1]
MWLAADSDPRLSGFPKGKREDQRAAVDACRTADLPGWALQRNEAFLDWEKNELADFFRTVEKSPLTEEQTKATVCFDNRVRVIAAAGSGKTSTMVARAGYAIRRGIAQPTEILVLAFNKKAAGELSERFIARLGDDGASVASSTFHAFGLRIIGEATGRKPPFRMTFPGTTGSGDSRRSWTFSATGTRPSGGTGTFSGSCSAGSCRTSVMRRILRSRTGTPVTAVSELSPGRS